MDKYWSVYNGVLKKMRIIRQAIQERIHDEFDEALKAKTWKDFEKAAAEKKLSFDF